MRRIAQYLLALVLAGGMLMANVRLKPLALWQTELKIFGKLPLLLHSP